MSISDFPTGPFPDVKTEQLSGFSIRSVQGSPESGSCEVCRKADAGVEFNIGCHLHHLCTCCFSKMMSCFASALKSQEGHWGFVKYDTAVCSLCGHDITTDFDSTDQAKEEWHTLSGAYRFCPHCGAKMVEGKA